MLYTVEESLSKVIIKDEPVVGPSFITVTGKFIKCPGDTHRSIFDYEQYASAGVDLRNDTYALMNQEHWIRVNDGSIIEQESYITLLKTEPTSAQYNALQRYLEYLQDERGNDFVSVEINGDEHNWQTYYLQDFELSAGDIIEKIKHYYTSGHLVESKEDTQKFINWAGQELADKFLSLKSRLKSPENDLYYWMKKSPEDLRSRLTSLEKVPTKKQQNTVASAGADFVDENEDYALYKLNTYEAAVKYGKGTSWCISSTEPVHNLYSKNELEQFEDINGNFIGYDVEQIDDDTFDVELDPDFYWYDYTENENADIYVLISKKESEYFEDNCLTKIAIAHHRNFVEFFDAEDNNIDYRDVPEEGRELIAKLSFANEIRESITEDINADDKDVLALLDKEFGQEDVYMWSTYILPNGHFLNPDNGKDISAIEPLQYEHCDFEDWLWSQGKKDKISVLFNYCLKMNVTWPYVSLPEKTKWTQEQQNALRKIIDYKNNFTYDFNGFEETYGFENVRKMKEPFLIVGDKLGDVLFDLAITSADDIIKAVNRGYARGQIVNESIGYHAGDLGKAEDYFAQSGGRGTGHFGTGTYFVGDEKKIDGYNDRKDKKAPHHKVEFDNYKLFKPRTAEEGYELHSVLKAVNEELPLLADEQSLKKAEVFEDLKKYVNIEESRFYPRVDTTVKTFDNFDTVIKDVNELIDIYNQEQEDGYTTPDKIEHLTNEHNIKSFDDLYEIENHYDYSDKIEMTILKLVKELRLSYINDEVEDAKKVFNRLLRVFSHKSESEIQNALNKTLEAERQYNNQGGWSNSLNKHWDSLSTVFMKALGYDGVDVRHLKELDNTTYGSVIYDVKPNTVVEDLEDEEELSHFSTISQIEDYLDKHLTLNDIEDWSESIILSEPHSNKGPAYILPNGAFIDVGQNFDTHDDFANEMIYELCWCQLSNLEDYENVIDVLDSESYRWSLVDYLEHDLGLLRVNDGTGASDDRSYISLWNINKCPTDAQLKTLEDWLYYIWTVKNKKTVEVTQSSTSKTYTFGEHTLPEDIIKKIKRAYTTGNLVEEVNKDGSITAYRVGEVRDDMMFFADTLDYYDYSETGYDKKDAHKYLITTKGFKVWDPIKELDLDAESWSCIWGEAGTFKKFGINFEYSDDIEEDELDDDWVVYTDTDYIAEAGKELEYDIIILRDIPGQGDGWNTVGKFTEYAVCNKNAVQLIEGYNELDDDRKYQVSIYKKNKEGKLRKTWKTVNQKRNELASKMYDTLTNAGFDVEVTPLEQASPNENFYVAIKASKNNNFELYVRVFETNKLLQFMDIYNENEGDGRPGKAIKCVLDCIDSSWEVEPHVNLNNSFWKHMKEKYPNFKWICVNESLKEEVIKAYHGSDAEFDTFDKSKIGTGNGSSFGKGFYFTTDKSLAHEYGKVVKKYKLTLNKPFNYYGWTKEDIKDILDKSGYKYDRELLDSLEIDYDDVDLLDNVLDVVLTDDDAYEVFSEVLKKSGYDGIIAGDEVIAFEPEQIKQTEELQEKIVKKGSQWQVQSEKGRNMGTYDTKAEAEKRLQQVHYFKSLKEWYEEIEDTPIILTDNLSRVKEQFNNDRCSYRCCYDMTEDVIGLSELELEIHDNIEYIMFDYATHQPKMARFIEFSKKEWKEDEIDEEVDYYNIKLSRYEYENFFIVWLDEYKKFEDTKFYEVLGNPIKTSSYIKENLNEGKSFEYSDVEKHSIEKDFKGLEPFIGKYTMQKVNMSDIIKDTHIDTDTSMKDRREKTWGNNPDNYHFDAFKNKIDYNHPIRLSKDKDGYNILDGHHRLRALANDGFETVEVMVRDDTLKENINEDVSNDWKTILNKNNIVYRQDNHTLIFNQDDFDRAREVLTKNDIDFNKVNKNAIELDDKYFERQPLSKEQEEFFKNSKIRDDKGNLLVCYHGTKTPGFDEFNHEGDNSQFGNYKFGKYNVNFFATNKKVAVGYTDIGVEDNNNVYYCYLNVTNPYIVNNETEEDVENFKFKQWNNIKDKNIRDRQLKVFENVWDKWNGRVGGLDDTDVEEINKDLKPLNVAVLNTTERDYADNGYGKDENYYDLITLGENTLFGAKRPLLYSYELDELFDDDMYEEFRDNIVGDTENYSDDYYLTTNDVIRFVLWMNENEGTDYDGIIISDIYDIGPTGSLLGDKTTDIITLKSANQIKKIDNTKPTNSNNINEEIDFDYDGRGWIKEDGSIVSTMNGPHHTVDYAEKDNSKDIRYNFGYERYVGLPKEMPTEKQLNTLTELLDYFFINKDLVGIRSNNIELVLKIDDLRTEDSYKTISISPKDYTTDEVIKLIKRLYAGNVNEEYDNMLDDIKNILETSNEPRYGSCYLLDNGLFVFPYAKGEETSLSFHTDEEEVLANNLDKFKTYEIEELLGRDSIALNSRKSESRICIMQNITKEQENKLVDWIYFIIDNGNDYFELQAPNLGKFKTYHINKESIAEDLVKDIKRYLATSVNENIEKSFLAYCKDRNINYVLNDDGITCNSWRDYIKALDLLGDMKIPFKSFNGGSKQLIIDKQYLTENLNETFTSQNIDEVLNSCGYVLENGDLYILDEYHGEDTEYRDEGFPEFSNTHSEEDTCIRLYKEPNAKQYEQLEKIIDKYLEIEDYCKIELWKNGSHYFYKSYSLYDGACEMIDIDEEVGNWTGYKIIQIIKSKYTNSIVNESKEDGKIEVELTDELRDELEEFVKREFKTSSTFTGHSCFLLEDGTYLDVGDAHLNTMEKIIDFLYNKKLIDEEDKKYGIIDDDFLELQLNAIHCGNDNWNYLGIQKNNIPTEEQYRALKSYDDYNMSNEQGYTIEVYATDGVKNTTNYYDTETGKLVDKYGRPTSAEAKIRNFYNTGKFLNTVNEKIIYRGETDSNYSKLYKKNLAGLFFYADDISDWNDTDFGDTIKYDMSDDIKLYKGQSSEIYCMNNDELWNKEDDRLFDLIEQAGGYSEDTIVHYTLNNISNSDIIENSENPDVWFACTQLIAKEDLEKKGYDGAEWSYEDDLVPHQYQIWNLNKVKRLGKLHESVNNNLIVKSRVEGNETRYYFYEGCKYIGTCLIEGTYLDTLNVDDRVRGQGYGSRIMKYIIENLHVDNLLVEDKNEVAINLYKKYGFKIVETQEVCNKTVHKMQLTESKKEYLYHATYKPFLKSIKEKGLGNTKKKMWSDSKGKGVVYLSDDKDVAISYAESSEWLDDVEDYDKYADNIIVLKIDKSKLDKNKLFKDENVQDDNSTFEYHDIIPFDYVEEVITEQLKESIDTYFKNSKVRDEKGNLLVCYHGSDSDRFEEFKYEFIGDDNKSGYGFYFTYGTPLRFNYESEYACYLNITKPLTDPYKIEEYVRDGEELRGTISSPKEIIDTLAKKYNCDGIINKDRGCVVAFYPNQIKVIDNENPTKSNNINEKLESPDESKVEKYLKDNFTVNKILNQHYSYLILKDGTVLGADYHPDMIDSLCDSRQFSENEIRFLENYGAECLVSMLGCIRATVNPNENYISLPSSLTSQQYDRLVELLDMSYQQGCKDVTIIINKGENIIGIHDNNLLGEKNNFKVYSLKDYTTDEIIKKIKRAYTTGELVESSKYEDNAKLIKECGKEVYHITFEDNLDNILENGLTNFWFGTNPEDCDEMVTINHKDRNIDDKRIICVIPTKALDVNKCDFTLDTGNGADDEWAGTGYYKGTISSDKFKIYDYE